jgi:hypothetical protein
MVGYNFGNVGDMAAVPINDLIPSSTVGLNAGASAASADNIQVKSGVGYDIYFLCNGNIGKGGAYVPAADGWLKVGESVVTADAIPNGGAFWYVSQSATEGVPVPVTLAGEVLATATKDTVLAVGLNMIANGYAADLVLNDATSGLDGGTAGASAATADNIQIKSGVGYDIYFLCNGNIGKGGAYVPAADGWLKVGESVATTDALPAGQGAWYVNNGTEITWTASIPYTL